MEKSIEEYKQFWDGPKVGFNEKLYKKYLESKRKYREKVKQAWKTKMN